MRNVKEWIRQQSTRLIAVAIILVCYGFTRLPALSEGDRRTMSARFAFTSFSLPELSEEPFRTVRPVHPSLGRISAWISSVGASIALNDIDGDGVANDLCYVDTRTDEVIVSPVPGSTARYRPFGLRPTARQYNRQTMAPMGCLPGDINEDGWMDLLVYYWGRTPLVFLRREPSESSPALTSTSLIPRAVVQGTERWFTNAATRADVDGDGHVDLIIGNYFPDNARILDRHASGAEHMQHSMSRAHNGGHNRILLWKAGTSGSMPSVQFEEVDRVFGEKVARGWTLAVGAADLDGDLRPEIYFANDFGPDRLLHNRSTPGTLKFAVLEGRESFMTPSSKVLGRDSFKGMGADFADINGDGWLDIYVSNIAAEFALEESHFVYVSTGQVQQMHEGIAPYVDQSESLGLSRSDWGWESRFADFDNDGTLEAIQATGFVKGEVNRWPELQELATGNDELLADPRLWLQLQPGDDLSGHRHNPFFVQAKSGRYFDIAPELGLDEPHVSRGIATADTDGDGDLDFAIANQWERSYFYRNDLPRPASYLGLHLLLALPADTSAGTRVHGGYPARSVPGRAAIGAAATIYLPDGRTLVQQVDGGNGHSGARSPELHFGLGPLPGHTVLRAEIRWRDVEGRIRREILHFTPGRHTVLLPSNRSDEEHP